MRNALTSLDALSDDDLWQIVCSAIPGAEYGQFTELRANRRAGTFGPDKQATLERFTQEADLRTLRKAYAGVLLKWRGRRWPVRRPDHQGRVGGRSHAALSCRSGAMTWCACTICAMDV
jgi:hypothetical protein